MRKCDLYSGAIQIRKALERMEHTWADASEQWTDGVSHRFREQRLEPIIPDVKLALDAISRMQQLMDEAQRELDE